MKKVVLISGLAKKLPDVIEGDLIGNWVNDLWNSR